MYIHTLYKSKTYVVYCYITHSDWILRVALKSFLIDSTSIILLIIVAVELRWDVSLSQHA